MFEIYYTGKFKEKTPIGIYNAIKGKLKRLEIVKQPETFRSIGRFDDILVYRKNNDYRVVIEDRLIYVNEGKSVNVLFVRDFFYDDFWNRNVYPNIKDGTWLEQNPLAQEDIVNFKKEYNHKNQIGEELQPLPNELNRWLNEYEFAMKFNIYEKEDWVAYSTNKGRKGLEERNILLFKKLFASVYENPESKNVYFFEKNTLKYIISEDGLGLIYDNYVINGTKIILIYDGRDTKLQKEAWKEILLKYEEYTSNDETVISEVAFRAYPEWVLRDQGEKDLWILIERSDGISNLSLLPEQIDFLEDFKFPSYINGQAGSGKSTMLYYLFANVYFYKMLDEFHGEIIFLTENENLLRETQKAIMSLLQLDFQFTGIDVENISNTKYSLASFKNFLLNILPSETIKDFDTSKYLDFGIFKEKYNNRHEKSKCSAEEVWFVISTYTYGYYEHALIDTVEKYLDEGTGIPSKFRIIEKDRFIKIIKEGLPFYKNLLKEGWWDKNTLVRKIREIYPNQLPDKHQYTVIFCDEAQDFSRIELRLILQSSIYVNYDLSSENQQIPIVFAGDALQTVNPTGFSERRLHQMFYDTFKEKNYTYDKKESKYNPTYNYRSIEPIVKIANIVQSYRVEVFGEKGVRQSAKLKHKEKKPVLYPKEWIEQKANIEIFNKKFQYKSFIVPADLNEEESYKNDDLLLKEFIDVKSSISAKGAEYTQVVVYGFGEEYINCFGSLNWEKKEASFKEKFFFNKLYVAITRAQKELIIIDNEQAIEQFWIPILSQKNSNPWEEYTTIEDLVFKAPETFSNIVADSYREDAYENALQDLELGKKDRNTARLSIAGNIFMQLNEDKKAYECYGHRDSIREKWETAADHFVRADKQEEAAVIYFENKEWHKLRTKLTNLRTEKQELRLLIVSFMQNETWLESDLRKINGQRNLLNQLLYDVEWRRELIDKLILFTQKTNNFQIKRDAISLLESIIKSNENDVLKAIGYLYFETRQYDKAIETWDNIIEKHSNGEEVLLPQQDFYIDYAKAQIEKAKDEANLEEELKWYGRIIIHKTIDKQTQRIFSRKLLEHYEDINEKEEFLEAIYLASILQQDLNKLVTVGQKVEKQYNKKRLLKIYEQLIHSSGDENISLYLKERWIKVYSSIIGIEQIDNINQKYQNQNFSFEEEPYFWKKSEIEEISIVPQPIPLHPTNRYDNIDILNFRGFKQLNVRNIGRYNLILGNNNVGKTSILEALLFSPNIEETTKKWIYVNNERGGKDHENFNFLQNLLNKYSEKKEISFSIKKGRKKWFYSLRNPNREELSSILKSDTFNENNYILLHDKNQNNLSVSNFTVQSEIKLINFVPFGKGYSNELANIYYQEIGRNRKLREEFIEQMKIFIPDIAGINIDPKGDKIEIEEKSSYEPFSLYNYGEGANKLFRILVHLHKAKNNRLMIDEIDAGIHHTNFKKFWCIILKVAEKNNVQLFVTTHNDECIRYFKEVLEEKEFHDYQKDARAITLDRHVKTNDIIAITRDFEQMEYVYDFQMGLRGRKL